MNVYIKCRFANISRQDHLVGLDRDVILSSKMGFKRTAYVAVEWIYLLRNTEEFSNF